MDSNHSSENDNIVAASPNQVQSTDNNEEETIKDQQDNNDNTEEVEEDEELTRFALLQKIKASTYPNDFLQHMLEEKGGPLLTPHYEAIINNEESSELKKFEEDCRLDYLLRMKNALNEKFENSAHIHPHGMTAYDPNCIPKSKRKGLGQFKMKVRRENYVYLNLHPDIDALVSLFLQKIIKAQPAEPVKFAGEFFTHRGTTQIEFLKMMEEEKRRLKRYRTQRTQVPGGPSQSTPKYDQTVGYRRKTMWQPKRMDHVNQIKKLGLGALAQDFLITPPPSRVSFRHRTKSFRHPLQEVAASGPQLVEEPALTKKFYCGCKDPGRREKTLLRQKQKEEAIRAALLKAMEMAGEGYGPSEEEESLELYKQESMIKTASEVEMSEEEEFSDIEE